MLTFKINFAISSQQKIETSSRYLRCWRTMNFVCIIYRLAPSLTGFVLFFTAAAQFSKMKLHNCLFLVNLLINAEKPPDYECIHENESSLSQLDPSKFGRHTHEKWDFWFEGNRAMQYGNEGGDSYVLGILTEEGKWSYREKTLTYHYTGGTDCGHKARELKPGFGIF